MMRGVSHNRLARTMQYKSLDTREKADKTRAFQRTVRRSIEIECALTDELLTRSGIDVRLNPNGIDGGMVPIFRTESVCRAHRRQHGVVDVQSFSIDVHDVACLESTVGAGNRVEDSG